MKVTCIKTGKQAYGTRNLARETAMRCAKQTNKPYWIYSCPECGCWHLTRSRYFDGLDRYVVAAEEIGE